MIACTATQHCCTSIDIIRHKKLASDNAPLGGPMIACTAIQLRCCARLRLKTCHQAQEALSGSRTLSLTICNTMLSLPPVSIKHNKLVSVDSWLRGNL